MNDDQTMTARPGLRLELVLVGGERRVISFPSHTGSIGNALDRLDDWIETDDGGWVHKPFIVEVRRFDPSRGARPAGEEELARLGVAAGELAEQARQ